MADEPTPTTAPPTRIYANAVSAHGGPFDLTLDLGYRSGGGDGPVEFETRVVMSWEHAKVLSRMIGYLVDDFEGQVAPVPDLKLKSEEGR